MDELKSYKQSPEESLFLKWKVFEHLNMVYVVHNTIQHEYNDRKKGKVVGIILQERNLSRNIVSNHV